MPIRPPALDDRNFSDLVDELLARIPAHTPDWTNPRMGDPGRTLIELFAWLTDTLLYRVNLIPEQQRLRFLRLLGEAMRPAVAATGIVTLTIEDKKAIRETFLRVGAAVKGPVMFETTGPITILPVACEAFYKRRLTAEEEIEMQELVTGLSQVYQLEESPAPYVTTTVFAGGRPEPGGFDLVARAGDQSLWLALLAQEPELVEQVRTTLGANPEGGQQILNVGVVPALDVPALFEEIGPRAQVPHTWEITFLDDEGELDYLTLEEDGDSTAGLTTAGVVRLILPAKRFIGAPSNDLREQLFAGVGDRPPRIDSPALSTRLVAWIRLRPSQEIKQLDLSWVGINAVLIDQRQTLRGRVAGSSDGAADQEMFLPGQSVERATFLLQVEETGLGYQPWRMVEDLAPHGRDDAVFVLDSEAGTVRFGDGVRGRIPERGRRVRVAQMRSGGGAAGNLPPDSLTGISGTQLDGSPSPKLKVLQPMQTLGGENAETLDEAERRIPATLKHARRAVTSQDYKDIAAETPGVRLGRIELVPGFKPHQRRFGVPGVVSVMVLPFKESPTLPNPRADRPVLERVHARLDACRPLATELYVIGCEYVPLGLGVGVALRGGSAREEVLSNVRNALRRFLWSLSPGGVEQTGWPLGGPVRDRELEVVVSQVPGIAGVAGVNLFRKQDQSWSMIPRPDACAPVELVLEPWQLPELLSVVVLAGSDVPTDLSRVPNPFTIGQGIGIPVVPEGCA